jgi:hypothetical protein
MWGNDFMTRYLMRHGSKLILTLTKNDKFINKPEYNIWLRFLFTCKAFSQFEVHSLGHKVQFKPEIATNINSVNKL